MVVHSAGQGDQYHRHQDHRPQPAQYSHGQPHPGPHGQPQHYQHQHEPLSDNRGPNGSGYQGGELSRLASHIGKMLEPKPIVVYYKKKRPGQQQEEEVPATPLGRKGEMAHAVPRGQRRVRNPPPRMTHLGPAQGGYNQHQQGSGDDEERDNEQRNAEFSCYFSRRPGEYLPDNSSDWRPVELRDDEGTPLPWEQRNGHSGSGERSAGTDAPLHANTGVKTKALAGPRDVNGGGNGNGNCNDELPPMVLQTMLQYDDDEFIAAANTIMEHIQRREVAHMDRKVDKIMLVASTNEGGDDGEGSTSNSTLSSSDTVHCLFDDLGKRFIEAFLSALEYRVDNGEQNEMGDIVMEIKGMVSKHAAYFVSKEKIRVSMEAIQTNDKEDNYNGMTEISREQPNKRSGFLPRADQSIAGYVPLEHNTPRSKNASDNQADEISIAKSFASSVKSAYEKIEGTLKSISREGSESNLRDKEKKNSGNKSSGRCIEPSGALVDQSQRRQDLVSEMQRLHAFMEKAGPMHSEVQRSCQYRIEKLRTELEAMTLVAVNDGDSNRSSDEEEGAPTLPIISPSSARRHEEGERDKKRDELIEKIEKLEQQLAVVNNRVVRASCERRIEQLQRDLTELDDLGKTLRSLESAIDTEAVQPSNSRDARDDSLQRQALIEEMKRVEHVLTSSRIEDVKHSCRVRLEELRLELLNLTPGESKEVPPSFSIAPSSRFSVREDRNSVINGDSASVCLKDKAPQKTNRGKRRHLKVMAPADLPGGTKFSARLGSGEEFLATVPSGGVRKGEIFLSSVGNIEEDLELGNSACGCIMPLVDYLYDKL